MPSLIKLRYLLNRMSSDLTPLAAFSLILGLLLGMVEPLQGAENGLLAINIALTPDEVMSQRAMAVNAQLLKAYPQGFALGDSHKPHITLAQRFVSLENLAKVYAALDKVMAGEKVTRWTLKATHYDFTPWENRFLGSIAIEPNDNISKLQQKLITAIAPFTAASGTASAFYTTPEEPEIDKATLNHVTTFVPERVGTHFFPHVTVGLARQDAIKGLIEMPFSPFTFSPAGVAVYQIGNFGTARKTLKVWQ